MKFFDLFLLILYAMSNVRCAKLDYSQDPVAEDNNGILWQVLYSKLNTILNETELLSERISDLSQRQDKLEINLQERLDDQDQLIKKSFNHSQKWTTILRRQDGSVDFYRNWAEYRKGFGNPDGEFFIGLDKLHIMTTYGAPQELLVVLGDWDNQTVYAKYDHFQVGSDEEKYNLKEVGRYSGNAGDSLSYHKGMNFTTKDYDNSLANHNCAVTYSGAWWFNSCRYSHLNGIIRPKSEATQFGLTWYHWKGNRCDIKFAEMLIRSRL